MISLINYLWITASNNPKYGNAAQAAEEKHDSVYFFIFPPAGSESGKAISGLFLNLNGADKVIFY